MDIDAITIIDMQARIRTLEAERDQARKDRDLLAIEVIAARNYDNLHEPGRISPPREQINEARKAVDEAGVLYRTGTKP